MTKFVKRTLFLTFLFLYFMQGAHAVILHYQETALLEVNEPASRTVTSCSWTCSSSNISFITRDNYGNAIIEANRYFTGSVTISARYTYQYLVASSGEYKTGSGSKSFIVSCSPIYATLSKSEMTLSVGERSTLTYTLDTRQYGIPPHVWTSSNTRVATVDETGEISAVGVGTATITLNPGWGPSVQCSVTVQNKKPTSITIPSTLTLRPDETHQISPSVLPTDATYTLSWTSTNKNVATVSSTGLVRGISAGTTQITVLTDNSLSSTCSVTVIPYPTSISINETETLLKVSEKKRLSYSFYPSDAQSGITWTSDNPSVVSVNQYGWVEALSQGDAKITCMTFNGKQASVELHTYVLGDVDGDGEVCVADLSAIVNYIHGKLQATKFITKAADVNEDGQIDDEDLKLIESMIIL